MIIAIYVVSLLVLATGLVLLGHWMNQRDTEMTLPEDQPKGLPEGMENGLRLGIAVSQTTFPSGS